MKIFSVLVCLCLTVSVLAEEKFAELGSLLPTPSEARLGSGAPGPDYWQQEANYVIEVTLDEKTSTIVGREMIEYVNHSPHTLQYLWIQLDQNYFANDSKAVLGSQRLRLNREIGKPDEVSFDRFRTFLYEREFEGGYRLGSVTDSSGEALPYQIVNTNMRIDLPSSLKSGESIELNIEWEFNIVDEANARRNGRKKLEGGGYAYHIAQWYPRMCAYYDQEGWQVKPYVGSGEFALEFGTFHVSITVPEDFIVAATGTLGNADEVLSETQRDRLETAHSSAEPTQIVTEEEAAEKLANPATGEKTWEFSAENVRDFAFATSRGYIWDGKGVEIAGEQVVAMSVYPKEASALWSRYSTEAVIQALSTYSEIVYPYPYPVAWSAWGPTGGMEYPMISFQSSWDIDDEGTYTEEVRAYVIGVIIHEIGHIWFPMIINSDERRWMWQDEGFNTFVENIAATSFDHGMAEVYRDEVDWTIDRMKEKNDPIIMTASDNQSQRGFQAYRKPALGLSLLRESILGRELFDFAFQEYARRWAFKRPTPADFFRTMEDASGTDLDWFWRGWFYGNNHVDMAVESVEEFNLDDGHPEGSKSLGKAEREEITDTPLIALLNEGSLASDKAEHLQDWYYGYDKYAATEKEIEKYDKSLKELEAWQCELLEFDQHIYIAKIKNVGGLVMPIELDIILEDGTERRLSIPVEIWRYGSEVASIPFVAEKAVKSVEVDRDNAFADANLENNVFPRRIKRGLFKLKPDDEDDNPMREALYPDEDDESEEAEKTDEE